MDGRTESRFQRGPRSYPAAQMTRDQEPYHYQRDRQLFNRQPRAAQPNTYQPNQKSPRTGWGLSTRDYWAGVFNDYLKSKDTSLMGRR